MIESKIQLKNKNLDFVLKSLVAGGWSISMFTFISLVISTVQFNFIT